VTCAGRSKIRGPGATSAVPGRKAINRGVAFCADGRLLAVTDELDRVTVLRLDGLEFATA
jgi:hypothetical protein